MNKAKKLNRRLFTWEEHRRQLLKDPKVFKAYQELQPEFAIIDKIIRMRIEKGITQKELAKRMKTKQSAISRLELGNANPSLNLLQRLAKALDSRLEIHFLPR